ncbi:MAG: chitin deacetylase, partial [Alphaproteobacteria bacterium]|nr:chitin deacetylase [Alphaproteobacteria bacterium]
YPSTNIRLDQLDEHVRELTSGRYMVMPLPELAKAIRERAPLPDRAVAITIDDAVRSVYTDGWPRLRKANLPFTLFVATEAIDRKLPGYMTWEQLREMVRAGVTIGNHTVSHAHLADLSPTRIREEIRTAQARLSEQLGVVPLVFAYPYGEASLEAMSAAREFGFVAAFGQHSGVPHPSQDDFYWPRFALNENYGAFERVRGALEALPLAVRSVVPLDPTIRQNPPIFSFALAEPVDNVGSLRCFAAADGAHFARTGEDRFEIRFDKPLPAGRTRINCTVPAQGGRFRWFSMQYYVPGPAARGAN